MTIIPFHDSDASCFESQTSSIQTSVVFCLCVTAGLNHSIRAMQAVLSHRHRQSQTSVVFCLCVTALTIIPFHHCDASCFESQTSSIHTPVVFCLCVTAGLNHSIRAMQAVLSHRHRQSKTSVVFCLCVTALAIKSYHENDASCFGSQTSSIQTSVALCLCVFA